MIPNSFPPKFRLGLAAIAVVGCGVLGLVIPRAIVYGPSSGRVHRSPKQVPERSAALVLGCSPKVADGRTNLYFAYRIEAAAELFRNGRVKNLIVSGANPTVYYDEPTAMKKALMAKGIPEKRIHCDYAGFRTLDSVVRAKEIFSQDKLVIVSQEDHCRRAIYIANRYGIDAVGFSAKSVRGAPGLRTTIREQLARIRMLLDVHVLQTSPKFLGPKIPIDS